MFFRACPLLCSGRAAAAFASLSLKGSAASAPPNIGGVSEGRGGFAALRIPHASHASKNHYHPYFDR